MFNEEFLFFLSHNKHLLSNYCQLKGPQIILVRHFEEPAVYQGNER